MNPQPSHIQSLPSNFHRVVDGRCGNCTCEQHGGAITRFILMGQRTSLLGLCNTRIVPTEEFLRSLWSGERQSVPPRLLFLLGPADGSLAFPVVWHMELV
eukprot:TRINITY_DN63936_c0_g4_i1.p1 TRINITY_DN63936_c0_g4~~TRINITY_DN63936_c0_g4_i1.p1  ORF type:complete len:100 (-),score=11.29 TRINITY_DN63936_c0_g4_i1:21-320(-)